MYPSTFRSFLCDCPIVNRTFQEHEGSRVESGAAINLPPIGFIAERRSPPASAPCRSAVPSKLAKFADGEKEERS